MEDRASTDGPGLRSKPFPEDENENGEMAIPEPPCGTHPELFFSPYVDERLEPVDERTERVLQAKTICLEQCPYRFSCLMMSLTHKEKWGIWGGWQRTDRRDFKLYLAATGFDGLPNSEAELEWEVRFFEGTDPDLNGSGPRPLTFKYGIEGLDNSGDIDDDLSDDT